MVKADRPNKYKTSYLSRSIGRQILNRWFASSWILASSQLHRVISGRLKHSELSSTGFEDCHRHTSVEKDPPVLWRRPFCAVCQNNSNAWNIPSLEQSLGASPQPVQCQQNYTFSYYALYIVIMFVLVCLCRFLWQIIPLTYMSYELVAHFDLSLDLFLGDFKSLFSNSVPHLNLNKFSEYCIN